VPIPIRPSITKFVQPNADKAIDLGKYKKVLVFGDSNMILFAWPATNICKIYEQRKHRRANGCSCKWKDQQCQSATFHEYSAQAIVPRIQTMIHTTLGEETLLASKKWPWSLDRI
jgi:hypothetical protein